jgi:hypothetical protein
VHVPRVKHIAIALLVALVGTARAEAPAPEVKLLDAGKGPKTELRLTAKVGMKRSLSFAMQSSISIELGGKALPQTHTPEIQMTITATVTDVDAKTGDIRYELVFAKPIVVVDAQTTPAVREAVRKVLVTMEGIKGHAVVSNRGFTKEADLEKPATLDPSLESSLEDAKRNLRQFVMPLPDEAVGVGAKWEATTHMEISGMQLDQVAVYALTSIKRNTIKMTLDLRQHAVNQTISRGGVTVDVKSMNGSGSGDIVFDLTKLMPSHATSSVDTSADMVADGQAMTMRFEAKMRLPAK